MHVDISLHVGFYFFPLVRCTTVLWLNHREFTGKIYARTTSPKEMKSKYPSFLFSFLHPPVLFFFFWCVSGQFFLLSGICGGNEDSWEVLHTHPVCGDV